LEEQELKLEIPFDKVRPCSKISGSCVEVQFTHHKYKRKKARRSLVTTKG